MRHAMALAIGLTGRDADTVDVHLAVGDGVGTVRAREREAVGRDAGRQALDAADVELYRAGEGLPEKRCAGRSRRVTMASSEWLRRMCVEFAPGRSSWRAWGSAPNPEVRGCQRDEGGLPSTQGKRGHFYFA